MLSNTFEASLQAVNPKLTLPYWDFTIETSSTGGHLGQQEPQRFSPMLTPEYFGDVDEEDHMVGVFSFLRTSSGCYRSCFYLFVFFATCNALRVVATFVFDFFILGV